MGKTKKGKGTKLMLMTDAQGIPISAFATSAQTAEVSTLETLVDLQIAGKRPTRLLYDKAADAVWLQDSFQRRGTEQITTHRDERKKPPRHDGRSLRGYQQRWKIKRTINWLACHKRLLVRHNYYEHLLNFFSSGTHDALNKSFLK